MATQGSQRAKPRASAAGSSLGPAEAPLDQHYKPYAIDWRFLPEPLLLIKDATRHVLASASNAVALTAVTNELWVRTLGRRTLRVMARAGRVFIHIPKTGGTSICSHVYGRNLPHYTRSFLNSVYGDRLAGLPSFSVVRDPVDRLQSAYRFMRSGGSDLVATSRFEQVRLPALTSFADFAGYLVDHPQLLDRQLLLRPQSTFILDAGGRLQVDRVFVADMEGGVPPGLTDYLGIGTLPRLNASRHPAEPVRASLRSKIEALYAVDLRLVEQVRDQSSGSSQL